MTDDNGTTIRGGRNRTPSLILGCVAIALVALMFASVAGAQTRRADSFPPPGAPEISSQNCTNCTPPLVSKGGPVLGSTGPVTITPIYWVPAGFNLPSPTYQPLISRFLTDVAAASTVTSNVFSTATEYSQTIGGQTSNSLAQIAYNGDQTDTTPYPASGCAVPTGFTVCISDDQMVAELKSFIAANNLPEDMSHIYAFMFPASVANAFNPTDAFPANYCGYHNRVADGPNTFLWMNEPAPVTGCFSGQSPNGDLAADSEISVLSHEIMESITDPLLNGWGDSKGNENGDECAWTFGPPLGSTDPANAGTTGFNQVINGNNYYVQTMFSNADFASGPARGCVTGESQVGLNAATPVTTAFALAHGVRSGLDEVVFSTGAAAIDLHHSTPVTVQVIDSQGEPVGNDHVSLSVTTDPGSARVCGRLSQTSGTTDAHGNLSVTYTANGASAECTLIAVEAATGQHGMTTLYLGKLKHDCPLVFYRAPSGARAGRATRFSALITDPGPRIPNALLFVSIAGSARRAIATKDVHLQFRNGERGRWYTAAFTVRDGALRAYLSAKTFTFPAHGRTRYFFRLALGHRVGGRLRFTVACNQMNLASNSPDGMYARAVSFRVRS